MELQRKEYFSFPKWLQWYIFGVDWLNRLKHLRNSQFGKKPEWIHVWDFWSLHDRFFQIKLNKYSIWDFGIRRWHYICVSYQTLMVYWCIWLPITNFPMLFIDWFCITFFHHFDIFLICDGETVQRFMFALSPDGVSSQGSLIYYGT